jgi:hypothetical protein
VSPLVRVVIEIERCQRTVRGEIAVAEAPAIPFFGWLELLEALEQATQDPPPPAP